MKKLLIAGGKFADIPTIKSAKILGYYVVTSGNNPNDLGHSFADEVVLCDYSDMDSMLQLAKKLKVDAIISSCDDVSTLTCSYVANELKIGNFDTLETAKIIHYKDLWRKFLKENSLPCPKAMGFDNINEASLEIPNNFKDSKIIIKPVDFATGKGVSIAYANEDLDKKLQFAFINSKSNRIVVEEFIDGSNHGFSTILQNQKVAFYFYDNEQHCFNPFAVSSTTTSKEFTLEIIREIINQIEQIARILNLKDGIFHTQIILHKNTNGVVAPFIIEACRRMGGDLYNEFISQACGIDYPSLCIQAHNQNKITNIFHSIESKIFDKTIISPRQYKYNGGIINHIKPRQYFSRACIMSKKLGKIKYIDLSSLSDYLIDSLIWAKSGDIIYDVSKYKAGIVFLSCKNELDLQNRIGLLHNCIRF